MTAALIAQILFIAHTKKNLARPLEELKIISIFDIFFPDFELISRLYTGIIAVMTFVKEKNL